VGYEFVRFTAVVDRKPCCFDRILNIPEDLNGRYPLSGLVRPGAHLTLESLFNIFAGFILAKRNLELVELLVVTTDEGASRHPADQWRILATFGVVR
jgi:hypothetical protein